MTTKNHCLFLKDTRHCLDSHYTDHQQYSNLNLNKIHKNSNVSFVHSNNNKSSNVNKIFAAHKNEETERFLNKSNEINLRSNFFNSTTLKSEIKEETKKQWKNDKTSSINKNNSTLSLHISAYENSSGNTVECEKNSSKMKEEKQSFIKKLDKGGLRLANQNSFELPRQQEENKVGSPEVMQFKASQKLLNPYQSNASNQQGHSHQQMATSSSKEMNLCGIRYCYLKAVESSEYCYKHVKEECLIKETSAPKCSFISEMKLQCDETVNNQGALCDRHAHYRKLLAEMERDFVSSLDYISKNSFENISVIQQDDVEHGFEINKADITKKRKEFINRNETTFAKLAAENFLKVYAANCDEKLTYMAQSPVFMDTINEARMNKVAEDTYLRVIAEFSQTRLKQNRYERKYIEKGKEILKYYKDLRNKEKNKMEISEEDQLSIDVAKTAEFMVKVVSGEIPIYDPRIPAEYLVSRDFNRKPLPNITCTKCRKLAIFKGLCLDHSRQPVFDEADTFGYQAAILDETGEPNNPEASKTSGLLFIHGRSGEKEISSKASPRNTYSNWSTRSQHGLIANLPSTSDLFIRTAKNARYPLVNAPYHSPIPTINPAVTTNPRMTRMQNPQPQITFSRTLALGHPPTRLRFDHNGQLIKNFIPASHISHSPATSSTFTSSSSAGTNLAQQHQHQQHDPRHPQPQQPPHQPTYTVIQRYPHEYTTATIIQTNDPAFTSSSSSTTAAAFRARQRLPQPPGYRFSAPPTFRVVRHPTIRIMTGQPRIVPAHQPRQP